MSKLYEKGLYVFAKWDFIFIAPPMIISDEQIDEAVAILDEGLNFADNMID